MSITLFATYLIAMMTTADANLLVGGGFEKGLTGWGALWTRTPAGHLKIDTDVAHEGRQSAHIQHTGSEDWALNQRRRLDVAEGQIYELTGWLRGAGEGSATLCVTLRDPQDRVVSWSFGERTVPADGPWRQLRARFVIPQNGGTIEPRLIGRGPSEIWFDDARLVLVGTLDELRRQDLPPAVHLENPHLALTLETKTGAVSVRDLRNNHTWRQSTAWRRPPFVVLNARKETQGIVLEMLDPTSMLPLDVTIHLDADRAEFLVEISSTGAMPGAIAYPYAFATDEGDFLIMPVNEGISYPVDDETLPTMSYHLYGGHGLCMGWYGVTDGESGMLTIVETPDDAAVEVPRREGRLCLAPRWLPQKGQFGDARRVRYVVSEKGGYVAMCKRYREAAKRAGRLVTLAEKRKKNPSVDRLVGAVNVWCWESDAVSICREMQSSGIERILWSHRRPPGELRQLNALGVLTSRYDIYQDVMDPANFDELRGIHPDWPTEAWPDDIAVNADGKRQTGWKVQGKNGQWYPCGVLCDRQAVAYARRRMSRELKTHPYQSRFIDTTTAAPWRECYHPDHPMTRSESRHWKMELLRLVSEEFGLVTGSETGHEASVPYLHYFEGMLSLGPYRVPAAGRQMSEIVDPPPERVAKFQTGHFYRLPLWELVYHDCVVAQWYWGDYNNKLPSLWDRRDLFNALYGTPPMFMFNRRTWQKNRERFVQSYQTATPVARSTGYSEMLSHGWLTDDHAVQRTQFANGMKVTVNFGDTPYRLEDGTMLEPLAERVEE
ncbi:MAG: glycoside hydrolase [Pirellulaceae bacterium]